jgi:hypothetical protein
MSNGCLLLSPNEIAVKYNRELRRKQAELARVLFRDGSGVGKVVERSADECGASWSLPKWQIVFQDE